MYNYFTLNQPEYILLLLLTKRLVKLCSVFWCTYEEGSGVHEQFIFNNILLHNIPRKSA